MSRNKLASEMTPEELAKRREQRRKSYWKYIEKNRKLCKLRYRRAKEKNVEKLREQWRASKKKRWVEKHGECIKYSRELYARHRMRPEFRRLKAKQARRYYEKVLSKNPELLREKCRIYYRENKPKIQARQKENYYKAKVERILGAEDVPLTCESGCGRTTLHPTGVCQTCRVSTCKKCQKPMIQKWIGQRLHDSCRPKGDDFEI